MDLHPDLKDHLSAFAAAGVEYLIVGGYAVAFHGRPRFTKDLGVWLGETPDNLERAALALERFGAPDVAVDGLRGAGLDDIVWIGAPPVRVELFRRIPGVEFASAYARRETADWAGVQAQLISFDDLITAKLAAGREQDLLDVEELKQLRRRRPT